MVEKAPVQKTTSLSMAGAAADVINFKFVPELRREESKASREIKFKDSITVESEEPEKVLLVSFVTNFCLR